MKLKELAERTGASTASLKYWIRESVLPPGALRNQTTAVYDERHVERVALILTLRERFDASIARIRGLTGIIDDPEEPLGRVMERAQLIATGIAADDEGQGPDDAGPAEPDRHAELVTRTLRTLGWPLLDSAAKTALARALREAEELGYPFGADRVVDYARTLSDIAAYDVAKIRPEGSRDAVARNLLLGASAQARVLLAMNQLAHTSAAIEAAGDRGGPGGRVAPTDGRHYD